MTTTRRTFLKTVGATGAAAAVLPLGAAACAGGTGGEGESGDTVDVSVHQFADGLSADATDHLILGKDSDGLYAMTATCTHAACDLTQFGQLSAAGITCSCHGSTYDANGQVINGAAGPGQPDLEHYKLTLSDDKKTATVDLGAVVDATTRTAV